MLAHEFAVAGHNAAEILRPWTIYRAVDHHVPDLFGAELLRHWRKTDERVDLPLGQELDRLGWRMQDPVDVLVGVKPYILGHTGQEEVMHTLMLRDSDGLPLQVADGMHPLCPEQLEAADVHTS